MDYYNVDPFHENEVGVYWTCRAPIALVVNGMVYVAYGEHSPNQPLSRGAPFTCLNETTGEVIWSQYFIMCSYSYTAAIGDSIIVGLNAYDMQIYAIGQGPSVMTVEAPMTSTALGDSLVIRGTVKDGAPGLTVPALAVRFPQGVAAVSDASQSEWMRYVWMQFPQPSNATGVPVDIYVIDSNNNYRQIAATVSDASGQFTATWSPDIAGNFTVVASFAGSNSYYGSTAESSFVVGPAPATQAPYPPAQELPPFETYLAIAVIAIIVALAVTTLLLLRKRP